jgi:hypothetical protein
MAAQPAATTPRRELQERVQGSVPAHRIKLASDYQLPLPNYGGFPLKIWLSRSE